MKRITLFALLIIANLSCSKNDVTATTTDDATMSASIAGTLWTTSTVANVSAVYDKASTNFNLVGNSAIANFGFTLKKFTKAVGTFSLSDVTTNYTGSYTDVKGATIYTIQGGRTGSLVITKFDGTTIEGTFLMTTYNSKYEGELN